MGRRGFLYIASLGVVVFLTIASASLLMRGVSETALSARERDQTEAFHLADAGIDQASINLRTSDVSDDILSWQLPSGNFTIDPVPEAVGTLQWRVTAHGVSAGDPNVPRHLEAVVRQTPESIFQFAMFGDIKVDVSGGGGGAKTDSYDSRLGAYNACLSNCGQPDQASNKEKNGDVGTNSIAVGGITLNNNSFIDGRLVVGPSAPQPLTDLVTGYDPLLVSGDPKVVSESAPFPMPDVVVPGGLTCSDTTITGGTTLTLSPTGGPLGNGTYCYHDLTVQGNATLTATGKVTIYLTGELTAKGNSIIGVVDDPTKMLFQMSSSGGATIEQTITGSNVFYGAIYGPKATINVTGNAEFFGSVIAKTVNLGGSAWIHYDEALTEKKEISNRFTTSLVSWRERHDL